MKRYDFDEDEATECVDGEFVRYRDHRAEMIRLEAKLFESESERKRTVERLCSLLGGEPCSR